MKIFGIVLGILIIFLIFHYKTIINKLNLQENPNSSPTPKKSKDWVKPLRSVLWTLILLSLVILMIVGIVWVWPKVFHGKEDEPKPKAQTEVKEPVYENNHNLQKGEEIIIHIKPNYHYAYEGYGKKFYRQSFYQNGEIGPKELLGGGIPLKHNGKGSIKVVKVILSVYTEEGKVTVYHSKDLKELMKK